MTAMTEEKEGVNIEPPSRMNKVAKYLGTDRVNVFIERLQVEIPLFLMGMTVS